jgi:hypothetical protein
VSDGEWDKRVQIGKERQLAEATRGESVSKRPGLGTKGWETDESSTAKFALGMRELGVAPLGGRPPKGLESSCIKPLTASSGAGARGMLPGARLFSQL